MTYRAGVITGIAGTLFAGAVGAAAWWLVTSKKPESNSAKPVPPAVVGKILKESEINTLSLTPDAAQRLGIRTAPVQKKPMRQFRTYGGEVTVPAGRTILVASPVGGILRAPKEGIPVPGARVRKGQPIVVLLPLLSPEAQTTLASTRVEVDGLVKNARSQRDATRIALDRATRLLKEGAGSRRNADEAQAAFDLAEKALEAAEARRDLLAKIVGEAEGGTAAPIAIGAPEDGLLRTISASPGQNVPASAALFEIVDLSRVWLRVPVYVGDLAEIDGGAEATIGDLSGRSRGPNFIARPVQAPPSANALAATADLYYELNNREAGLAPGQRVGVTVPLKSEAESLTVPWSSVIHDVYGGTWVYEQTGEHVFARRRVQVRSVLGETAVLASGPAVGAPVVAEGAAELFGTEVGFSK